MKSGIYRITVNGKTYIGSALNLFGRKGRHLYDLRRGKHGNKKLQNAYNKYGEKSFIFSIIEYVNKESLISKEQHYIDLEKPFYNVCKVDGNTMGRLHRLETKEKMSRERKGKKNSLGRILSEETKTKISKKAKIRGIPKKCLIASKKANTGLKHSPERIKDRAIKQIKLSADEIISIKFLLKDGVRQVEIASQYGVSQRVISKIKNNIGVYATF
jgi:group I intron endonuclease